MSVVLWRAVLLLQAKQFPSTNSLGADNAIQNKSMARSAVIKAKSGIGKLKGRLSIAKKKGLNSSNKSQRDKKEALNRTKPIISLFFMVWGIFMIYYPATIASSQEKFCIETVGECIWEVGERSERASHVEGESLPLNCKQN